MIFITKEQRFLLCLLSSEITGKKKPWQEADFSEINWEILFQEANAQAVTLMLAEAILPFKKYMPESFVWWEHTVVNTVAANIKTVLIEQELNNIMGDYPFFILKGMAAASYYPKPQERILGDIDFLIHPSHKRQVTLLLEKNGYQNWNTNHICHVVLKKDYTRLEMHYELSGIPYGKPGKSFESFCKMPFSIDTWQYLMLGNSRRQMIYTTVLYYSFICSTICLEKGLVSVTFATGPVIFRKHIKKFFGM